MRPVNRMSTAKVAEFRSRIVGKAANKQLGKPPNGYPEERLISEKYMNPEPGVHILEVPCYLPPTNKQNRMMKPFRSKKTGRMMTQEYLLNEWRIQTRGNILAAFARHLPHMCVDQDDASRISGRAKKLRRAVHRIVLSRISPKVCDDDGAVGAVKGVRDTVCAWLVNGPIFDVNKIGRYDKIIYSPANPHGYVELIVDQIERKAPTHKQVTNTLPKSVRQELKASGTRGRALAGKYGCQIELHLDPTKIP
jgi:hypothetical protein